jgi:hypothetical protein
MIDPGKGPTDDGYSPSFIKFEQVIFLEAKPQFGKDVISFRARPPSRDPNNYAKSLTGHVFIYLGKELPDGTTVYYMVTGFYPDETGSERKSIFSSIIGPGRVEYKFSDMASSTRYDAYISEQQARMVEQIAEKWDSKNYSLFTQNCTNMVKDVASYLGMKMSREYSSLQLPTDVIDDFSKLNDKYSAIEHLKDEAKRGDSVIKSMREDHFKHIKNGISPPPHNPGLPGAANNTTVWEIPPSMKPGGGSGSGPGAGMGSGSGSGSGYNDGPVDGRMYYVPKQYPTGGVTVCTSNMFACL